MAIQKNQGFSVIEMLVVIAVLGVALGIGIGYLRSDRLAVNQAAQGLAAQVNRARLEAIKQNNYAGVCLSTSGSGGYSIRVSTTVDTVCPGGTLLQNVQFGQGDLAKVRLGTPSVAVTFSGIIFDSRGMARGSVSGTFPIKNQDGTYTKQVVVSAQGRATTQ